MNLTLVFFRNSTWKYPLFNQIFRPCLLLSFQVKPFKRVLGILLISNLTDAVSSLLLDKSGYTKIHLQILGLLTFNSKEPNESFQPRLILFHFQSCSRTHSFFSEKSLSRLENRDFKMQSGEDPYKK